MNKILAAAFGIAGNQISGAILELGRAYNTMKDAGVNLTYKDEIQYKQFMRQANELADFLNNFEWKNAINALPNTDEQAEG